MTQTPPVPDAANQWPEPIPLNQKPAVPPFPDSALPSVIADYVRGLAEATQTPVDMPASVALGSLSACVAGRATISPNDGWTEPLCLYVVTAMEPGNRKSAVFSAITSPVREIEQELIETARPIIAEAEALKEVKEGELASLKKAAIRQSDPASEGEYLQAARELAEFEIPVLPRILADDATPEAIGSIAAEQGGRLAIAAAEGGIFDIFAGRYSSGVPNIEVMLRGHAGDSFTVDRKGRESEHIDSLTLTFILTVQPSVLRQIGQTSVEKSRGELERFLYSVPESIVGHRTINPPPVARHVADAFKERMSGLARTFAPSETSYRLTLDREAQEAFVDVQVKNERRLRQDGELGSLRVKGWGSKLSGAVARIAGILHLADGRDGTVVSADLIEAADRIGDYFATHALAAFDLMDTQGGNAKAEELVTVIRKHGLTEFSTRDLMMKTSRSRFERAADLADPVEVLVDHGWIIPRDLEPRTGSGRPPSPRYLAHPDIFAPEKSRSQVSAPVEMKTPEVATQSTQSTEPQNVTGRNRSNSVDSVDLVATSSQTETDTGDPVETPPMQWGVRPEPDEVEVDLFGNEISEPEKFGQPEMILAHIAGHGASRPKDVAGATGLDSSVVRVVVGRLKDRGLLYRDEHGLYGLTEDAERRAS